MEQNQIRRKLGLAIFPFTTGYEGVNEFRAIWKDDESVPCSSSKKNVIDIWVNSYHFISVIKALFYKSGFLEWN